MHSGKNSNSCSRAHPTGMRILVQFFLCIKLVIKGTYLSAQMQPDDWKIVSEDFSNSEDHPPCDFKFANVKTVARIWERMDEISAKMIVIPSLWPGRNHHIHCAFFRGTFWREGRYICSISGTGSASRGCKQRFYRVLLEQKSPDRWAPWIIRDFTFEMLVSFWFDSFGEIGPP
jgi:hypothetical protein